MNFKNGLAYAYSSHDSVDDKSLFIFVNSDMDLLGTFLNSISARQFLKVYLDKNITDENMKILVYKSQMDNINVEKAPLVLDFTRKSYAKDLLNVLI